MQPSMKILFLILFTVASIGQAQLALRVEPLRSVDAFPSSIRAGATNPTDKLIVVLSQDRALKVYDVANLSQRATLAGSNTPITSILFTRQGSTILLGYSTGKIDLWNLSKEEIRSLDVSNTTIVCMAEAPQQHLLVASFDKTIKLIDIPSGKTLGSSGALPEDIVAIGADTSGTRAFVLSGTGLVRIMSLPGLSEVRKFDAHGPILRAAFSPDGKWIALGGTDGAIRLWDVVTGIVRASFTESHQAILALSFDPRSRWLIASSADSTSRMYDLSKSAMIQSIPLRDGYVTALSFVSPDLFWWGTTKGTVSTWSVQEVPLDKTPPVITIVKSDDMRRVFGTSVRISGLVRDENKIKEIVLDKGAGAISVAEAEEKDRVSGMVSESFVLDAKLANAGDNTFTVKATDQYGNVSRESIQIQRLTKDQVIEIVNPPNNFEADKVSVKLEFKLWSEASSYQVLANMVEVNQNRSVGQKKLGQVFSEEIPLSVGYNQIEIDVVLKDGQKITKTLGVSRKVYGTISAAPSAAPITRQRGVEAQPWAVVVGVSEYANKAIPSLHYADQDAQAFADFLQRPEGGGIQQDHMRLLTNKNATLANLKEALVEFLSQAIDKDLVIIFFAGHGAPDPARPSNLYMLTYDSDLSRLGTTAYPMWDMQTLLTRQLTAKRIVVFSDACHSGGISAEFATRGVNTPESNLINQYLADLARAKEGIVMFTASAAGEVSQEFPELGHGVFTYYLLEGMKGEADLNNDYTVTINELMQYVEDQVKRKTKGAQNPTRSQTIFDKDLTISKIAH
jgi:uncharacterized caspase-like protein/WD40 repeat protein